MIAVLVKVTLVCILALVAVRALKRAPSAVRHLLCVVAIQAVAVMPVLLIIPRSVEVLRLPLQFVVNSGTRLAPQTSWPVSSTLAWLWALGTLGGLARIALQANGRETQFFPALQE